VEADSVLGVPLIVPVVVLKTKPLGKDGEIRKEVAVPPETAAVLGDISEPIV
jgi:hypothetical protein